mgnify:CR=1 FL=1
MNSTIAARCQRKSDEYDYLTARSVVRCESPVRTWSCSPHRRRRPRPRGKPKIPEVDSADLTKGELFIKKLSTRSIGRGAVKSIAERGTGSQALIGLENDSMERLDVAADHAVPDGGKRLGRGR